MNILSALNLGSKEEETNNFGVNNYEQKAEDAANKNENAVTLDDFAEAGTMIQKFFTEGAPKRAAQAFKIVKSGLTPGFIKRMKAKKIHIDKIMEEESKIDQLQSKTSDIRAAELRQKQNQKISDKIFQEFLLSRQQLRKEVKEAIDVAKADQKEMRIKEYHDRRQEQLDEIKLAMEKFEKEEHERIEKEKEEQRHWRIDFFGQKAIELADEAASINPTKVRRKRNRKAIDRLAQEWENREVARTREQVELAPPSKTLDKPFRDLAIYGIDAQEEKDNYPEDFNIHDVHLFDSKPFQGFEKQVIQHDDIKSDLMKNETLYDSMQYELNQLKNALDRMYEMKSILEKEKKQINQEILSIEKDQYGPPRRMPMAHEIPSTDLWKKRSSQTLKKLKDLEYSISKCERSKNDLNTQSMQIAQLIAVLKDKLNKVQTNLDDQNFGEGNLPMVVGKSLSKIPGLDAIANPKETYDAMVQKSKFILIKDQSQEAMKLQKEKNKIDQVMWMERSKQTGKKDELESLISRITQISERLQRSKTDSMRLNIIDSLKGFIASNLQLNPVHKKLVGTLPWYKHHDYKLSCNILKYVTSNAMGAVTFEIDDDSNAEVFSNGVTLGPDRMGFCAGNIKMPKNSLWCISVTITRQGYGPDFDHPDESDFISIKIGPTIHSLSSVGMYFNKVNPSTGTVLYDVKHIFRGDAFAFRFDFSSTTSDVYRHLAICTGIYEEYEMQDLEIVMDPKDFHKTRVLSSYVKMIRVEEKSGKLRETRLLEELVEVEHSKHLFWDSQILTHTLQRYPREFFLRILKAEILLQQQSKRLENQKLLEEQKKIKLLLPNQDAAKEQRIEQSKKKYIMKKRAIQKVLVDEGREMIDQRLIIWDNIESRWRNVVVKDCIVNWVENGLIAKITHRIQEYDEGNDPVGEEIEIDLKLFKFFHSPIQEVDPVTLQRWKDKKKWNDEITRIDMKLQKNLDLITNQEQREIKKLEKENKQLKGQLQWNFENTIESRANVYIELPISKQAIKELIPTVLLDVRRGLVQIDSSKNKKAQAKLIAKDRYRDSWIAQQRQILETQLKRISRELEEKIRDTNQQFEDHRVNTTNQAREEQKVFKEYIQHQYQIQKKALLEKIQFPKEIFEQVKVKTFHCEHLRTKQWSNLYSKGIKCLDCNQEIGKLFEDDESQVLGFGTGGSKNLYELVKKHREDETCYYPTVQETDCDNGAISLEDIEKERIRLEKERRVMDINEDYFYDYQDLELIYEFDQRHKREIKGNGVFRQGLQWTEDELEDYERIQRNKERDLLEDQGLNPELMMEKFDALNHVEVAPNTYRMQNERHYANYKNWLLNISRIHNFQKKIKQYKLQRFEYIYEYHQMSSYLQYLHQESYTIEEQLVNLEQDLSKSSQQINIYNKVEKLWMHGNMILLQAQKTLKKLQMANIHLYPELKELQNQYLLIHDECMQLIKLKILIEKNLQQLTTAMQHVEKTMTLVTKQYEESQEKIQALHAVMPGNVVRTRYGICFIIHYREKDDMVLVNLPFGNPPAKLFIYYKNLIEYERTLQQNERLLMENEEKFIKDNLVLEKKMNQKEIFLMSLEEENNRKVEEFQQRMKEETSRHQSAIDQIVMDNYKITESRKFNKIAKRIVKSSLNKRVEEANKRRKEYIGPPTGRPKALTIMEVYRLRKQLDKELKEEFISKAAMNEQQKQALKITEGRSYHLQVLGIEDLIDSVVRDMIFTLSHEAIEEGKHAKLDAERKSGLFLPCPNYTSYHVYYDLANLWTNKKKDLSNYLLINQTIFFRFLTKYYSTWSPARIQAFYKEHTGPQSVYNPITSSSSGSEDPREAKKRAEEIAARKLQKKLKREERLRQLKLCQEMYQEEQRCKQFYQWELKENLRERRAMKEEESHMRYILLQEQKLIQEQIELQKLLQTRNPNDMSIDGNEAEGEDSFNPQGLEMKNSNIAHELMIKRNLGFSYEKRRQELKEITLERRRRQEEQNLMMIEDELSRMLQEMVLLEIQKKAYQEQYGISSDEDNDSDNSDDESSEDDDAENNQFSTKKSSKKLSRKSGKKSSRKSKKKSQKQKAIEDMTLAELEMIIRIQKSLPIPSFLTIPNTFYTWSNNMKNDYIKRMIMIYQKEKAIQDKIQLEENRLQKLMNKSYTKWETTFKVQFYLANQTELSYYYVKEDYLKLTSQIQEQEKNLVLLKHYCYQVGDVELKLKNQIKQTQYSISQYEQERLESEQWVDLCVKRNKNRDKLKRKVTSTCKWMDTDTINGFYQRYSTILLRKRIYLTYFHTIINGIINQSEMIINERRLFHLQFLLTNNKLYLHDRVKNLFHLLRDFKCHDLLRMKRSKLNEKLFPKERMKILSHFYGGWQRYYLWNKGMKEAFELKIEVIKQQILINRQFKKQLALPSSNNNEDAEGPGHSNSLAVPTLMSRVRERPIQCQHCLQYYVASQNNSLSCSYHPEEYTMQCPASCLQPGLTPLCSVHRKRRWGCCKLTQARAPGCSRRYHKPSDVDPIYEEIMKKINERDSEMLNTIDEAVTEIRLENYPQKVEATKKVRLFEIEKQIEGDREIANRFHSLKFV